MRIHGKAKEELSVQPLEIVNLLNLRRGISNSEIPGGRSLWKEIQDKGYIRHDLAMTLPLNSKGEQLVVFEVKKFMDDHPGISANMLDNCECVRRGLRWLIGDNKPDSNFGVACEQP